MDSLTQSPFLAAVGFLTILIQHLQEAFNNHLGRRMEYKFDPGTTVESGTKSPDLLDPFIQSSLMEQCVMHTSRPMKRVKYGDEGTVVPVAAGGGGGAAAGIEGIEGIEGNGTRSEVPDDGRREHGDPIEIYQWTHWRES